MPRRRTAEVRETIEELHQLKEYYHDTPKATALHLLMLLKEDERRTIADAAKTAGISHRKAERLWKQYREVGLVGVVGEERGKSVQSRDTSDCKREEDIVVSALETLLMVSSVLGVRVEVDFVEKLRELVHRIAPSVSYVAANVVSSTLLDGENLKPMMTYSHLPNGELGVSVVNEGNFKHHYERIYASAMQNGVNLSRYVSPPLGQDYFYENMRSRANGSSGTYVGSLLFFGMRSRSYGTKYGGLSYEDYTLLVSLRPFFSQIFISRIQSSVSNNVSPVNLSSIVEEIKQQYSLTPTEVKVLMALSIGKNDWDIAELLTVSRSTIRTHVTNIQRKLGLRSRREIQSEIFSRANFISD